MPNILSLHASLLTVVTMNVSQPIFVILPLGTARMWNQRWKICLRILEFTIIRPIVDSSVNYCRVYFNIFYPVTRGVHLETSRTCHTSSWETMNHCNIKSDKPVPHLFSALPMMMMVGKAEEYQTDVLLDFEKFKMQNMKTCWAESTLLLLML